MKDGTHMKPVRNQYQNKIVINTLMVGGIVPPDVRRELAENWMEVGYVTCYDCLEGRSSLCKQPPLREFLDEHLAAWFGGASAEHTFGCRGAKFAVMYTIQENLALDDRYCDTIIVDTNCHYSTRITAEMNRLRVVEPPNSGYPEFRIDAPSFEEKILEIRKETGKLPALVVVTHVDPYFGNVAPVAEVGEICARHDVPYMVNGAYSCGILPVNMKEIGCDFLTMSGHKSLASLGPVGFVVSGEKWKGRIFCQPKSEKISKSKIPGIFGCSVGGLPVISSMLSFPHVQARVAEWDERREKILRFVDEMEKIPTVKQLGEKPHRHHLLQFETPVYFEVSKTQRKKGFFLAAGMLDRNIVGLQRGLTKKLKMSVYGLDDAKIDEVVKAFREMAELGRE